MNKVIKINSLRNVESLTFEMPKPGVYLLTGENGAGKSTLLACMRRIGYSNAFPLHFPKSAISEKLDSFTKASIVYEVAGRSVEYKYRGERWTPQPRTNSDVLGKFEYPSVVYIGATADRITPRPEDFKPNKTKAPSGDIVANANEVFGSQKFNDLKVANVTRGVSESFLFKVGVGASTEYYSERNFSLGELCVLKLLKNIESCPNNSLLLIDEIEMALHPSAQIRLFRLLERLAKPKNLTVIVSSHSVSLIKTVARANLIHLMRDESKIVPVFGAFPSFVLGGVADSEERTFDAMIYVEDEVAERIVTELVQLCLFEKFGGAGYLKPKVGITPIGGYSKVAMYLSRHESMWRVGLRCHALLDADVKEETVEELKAKEEWSKLYVFDKQKDKIKYLPWTPEVGMAKLFCEEISTVNSEVSVIFADHQLRIGSPEKNKLDTLTGKSLRDFCKKWFSDQVVAIAGATSKTDDVVINNFCRLFAKLAFGRSKGEIMELLCPLILPK